MIYCRAADTVYFRITSGGSFSYTFRYEMIPTGVTVTEPISTLATARRISLTDTLRGRVGYDGSTPDDNDYYTFVQPLRGSVRVRIKATNTSNSAGADMAIYVGRVSTSANIFTKSYSNRVPGSWEEEFTMSCLPADSLFLRVAGPSGCFTYELSFVDEPAEPEVSFETFRTGNEVTFVPKLLRTSSFIWNFDNGTTSTAQFPTVLYTTPANYEVSLIGFNQVCGTRDTASTWVVVKGLEYYTPDSAGAGGDAIMEIYGGGLDTTTQVVLRRNGIEMRPVRLIANPSSNQLSCFFDLHFADEGFYDLEITVPGQDPVLYPDGFRVTALRYPFCKSEVVGPSIWRINRDTRFKLVVSNTGNVMANGVVTALLWPKNVTLTFDTEWFRPPSSGSYQIAVGDGEIWDLDYADIAWLYDSLNVYTSIDSFQGQPYDGYMQLIQIPRISAQSTYEIPLIIRTATTGTPRLITFTYGPNLYGSGASGSWMDAVPNAAVEFADLLDMAVGETKLANTPIGWLTKATKASTTHLANLGESAAAISLVLDGTNETISQGLPAKFDQQVSAGNAQIAKELLDVATDKLVEKGADKLLMGQTEELNRWLANNPDASLASVEFAIENLNDLNNIREAIKDAYKTGKNLNTLKDKLGRLQELAKNCPELQKQLDDLLKELGQDLEQKDPKDKTPRAVTSMDPNAIYGPDGVRGYVKLDQRQYFTVAFENLATASAPAQLVTVYDTLNPAWFDLRSFAFEDVSLAAETYPIPQHRKEFTSTLDLRPRLPYKLLVTGKLDTLTGVITWRFITLDTLSGDLTEDPLGGFLPPNTIAQQGEGTVSYSVRLRSSLPEGTVTLNRAEIIFDENTSLFTNTWRNVVDIQAPVSSVSATAEDSVISLALQGTDAGSGMARYKVFVSENAGIWLPLVSTYEQTAQFTGTPGATYAFYVVAQDSVANRETKTPAAEATVTLREDIRPDADLALFPNPTTGVFSLTARLPQGNTELEIYDTVGRVVYTAAQ
ncbi:MAG: hypothetical protein SF053_04535, partial [Bacteroidia bacterium]|nr:hypothetical protein [Bacteroidia bacterium]